VVRRRALALFACAALACEGSGSGGDGLVVKDRPVDPRCTPVAGSFPSGVDLVPGAPDRAALVQFQPPALVAFELSGERPRALAQGSVPPDSDLDGIDDAQKSQSLGFFPLSALMGSLWVRDPGLALLSASNYEEVLFANPLDGALRSALVASPPEASGWRAADYPFLPPAGEAHLRTAVSTRACIYPGAGALDSRGDPVGSEARCDATLPSYFTTLTAGKAIAARRLFVATSNLKSSGQARFHPGTVLVYTWSESAGALEVRPDVETPWLLTTGFNPTGVARHVNAAGRELVLVVNTGAISAGTGAGGAFTAASVDVIDAASARIAASIPLGFAAPSFDGVALDPGGRVGLLGSALRRDLYAVDLAPLDDPRLYQGDGPPVLLDGLTPGFPDARIFDADHPLTLPDRADGPSPAECEGYTHVAVDAAGTQAFASDYCDGTLTRIRLDLSGSPQAPLPRERFQVYAQDPVFAPLTPDSVGLLRAPAQLRARAAGSAASSPELYVAVGLPDAQLCGLRLSSP
jgi:hypothetical protein